jgi:type II secretory pathway pseudopilin PulG
MKKLNNDKKDGITLILLLVVTMVVLLILAGVSINAVVGDDRVIKSAQESTKLTEESEAKKIMNKVVL